MATKDSARIDSARISPTAHYTGYVWVRNGLSDPALETRIGRVLYHALQPAMSLFGFFGAPSLEDILMARHLTLEGLLDAAIESGRVGQVVELASGLSPRGYRFMNRHRDRRLIYIEGELPGMCAQKRARLASMGGYRPGHHVVELDALCDVGPTSLAEVGRRLLDPGVGTAVITEGLVHYLSRTSVTDMWARIARFLARYPYGMYASDMHVRGDIDSIPGVRAFTAALAAFTRGAVHIHFDSAQAVESSLIAAGFQHADCRTPAQRGDPIALGDSQREAPVHVIHATMSARVDSDMDG